MGPVARAPGTRLLFRPLLAWAAAVLAVIAGVAFWAFRPAQAPVVAQPSAFQSSPVFFLPVYERGADLVRVVPAAGRFALSFSIPVMAGHEYYGEVLDAEAKKIAYSDMHLSDAGNGMVLCGGGVFGAGAYTLRVMERGPGRKATGRVFEFRFVI